MIIKIRRFSEHEYDMICSWWSDHGEFGPQPGYMNDECTFVLEYDDEPVMTMTVYETQNKHVSYFEGYCAKPGLEKSLRNSLGQILWDYCYEYLAEKGFMAVSCITHKSQLALRYQNLGMNSYASGLYSLGRDLICHGQQ